MEVAPGKGGAAVMENRLGIADPVELAHEEERLSKLAALALYRDGTLAKLQRRPPRPRH